jgi:hypothetical protein
VSKESEQARTALVALRGAVGASTWLAPKTTGRLFGIDPKENPGAPFVARAFAIRDFALAAGTAQAEGKELDHWLAFGIVADVSDALAGIGAAARRQIKPRHATLIAATALSAAGLGVYAMAE